MHRRCAELTCLALVCLTGADRSAATEATAARGAAVPLAPAMHTVGPPELGWEIPTLRAPGDAGWLPRNFGAVVKPETCLQPVGLYGGPTNYLARPWYVTPYRNYSYYRPWYTYGYNGPIHYRYHYAPSWGHAPGPYYAPPYLSPGAYAPADAAGGHP